MGNVSKYLSEEACAAIRRYVRDAGGNEVFLVGHVDKKMRVADVQVYARGNEFSAPALLQVAKPGDVVIHNHPAGSLRPSSADIQVASILGNDGVGFFIVNNEVSDVYAAVEPFKEKVVVPLKADLLVSLLAEDGPVSELLPNYEYRPEQLEMVRAVSAAINEDKVAMIEAGTGTGKTLAYLLPAITHALNNKERVVVSTNTINLQEQLIQKDLPFLQKVVKKEFKAVLVKGRSNYACRRKLADADIDMGLFSEADDREELQSLIDWAQTSKEGSKADLNFIPRREVWEKVQSESDTSLKTRCPFYGTCFFYTARRQAAVADLLVANHHLLFADLSVRAAMGTSENAILPGYDRIIFDEAHNIEDVATRYFGVQVTGIGVVRILDKIHRKKTGQEKGILVYLSNRINRLGPRMEHSRFLALEAVLQQGVEATGLLKECLREMMDSIFTHVRQQASGEPAYREIKLRLTPRLRHSPDWQADVSKPAGRAVTAIRKFTASLGKLVKELEGKLAFDDQLIQNLTLDLRAQLERLDAAAGSIEHVLLQDDTANVRWLEVKEGYKGLKIVRLLSAPLDVAPILRSAVYERFKNVIMTSATMTVNGRFDYLRLRFGLEQMPAADRLELRLPAPFDYEKQALVAVPVDIADPGSQEFAEALQDYLFEAIQLSRGRAFVLFTSYGLLNRSYEPVRERLETLGINCYKQGVEERHRLLARFREDVSSVLFATDSFWEGVDVQGEALELVVIVKLPFRVPTEPIVQARVEAIEAQGGNAFVEYSVPQAAIRFKQGFGRLIRQKTDRGAILVLDKRIAVKRYGQVFLRSLPKCRMAIGSNDEVMQTFGAFYQKGRASGPG